MNIEWLIADIVATIGAAAVAFLAGWVYSARHQLPPENALYWPKSPSWRRSAAGYTKADPPDRFACCGIRWVRPS